MKEDVLNLIATWTMLAELFNWLLILAAAIGYGVIAWLLYRAGRCIYDAISRAQQTVRHNVGPDALRLLEDLDTHLNQTIAADPELAAAYTRLHGAIREEKP